MQTASEFSKPMSALAGKSAPEQGNILCGAARRSYLSRKEHIMLGKKSYKDYAASHAPASHMAGNCARAFLFGGGICVLAQALCALYSMLGATEENSRLCSTFTLIALAALLTSLDVFDKIAECACAGTLVPITGFSNAISAEAISARSDESDIIGLSQKAFKHLDASMMI